MPKKKFHFLTLLPEETPDHVIPATVPEFLSSFVREKKKKRYQDCGGNTVETVIFFGES